MIRRYYCRSLRFGKQQSLPELSLSTDKKKPKNRKIDVGFVSVYIRISYTTTRFSVVYVKRVTKKVIRFKSRRLHVSTYSKR